MRWWPWKNRDEDLARELQSDLELEEEEQQEFGLSAEEAHFAAVRAFGNPTVIREQTRAVWTWNWLERLLRDLKYGVRTLWRSPSFSIVSVLVMALGIGATTSLFTIVRAVLQRLCRTKRWLLGAIVCVHFMMGDECISELAVLVFGRPVDQQGFTQSVVMVLSDANVDVHASPHGR
jgi:hypothetical protein